MISHFPWFGTVVLTGRQKQGTYLELADHCKYINVVTVTSAVL